MYVNVSLHEAIMGLRRCAPPYACVPAGGSMVGVLGTAFGCMDCSAADVGAGSELQRRNQHGEQWIQRPVWRGGGQQRRRIRRGHLQ